MEKINLNNYEAFFLDYLEGSLSAQQEFELMDFLEKHPALKEELDMDLDELTLDPQADSIDTSLFKKEGVKDEEVEDLMVASVEGLLSVKETAALTDYVVANDLHADLAAYNRTKLKPNLAEVYGNKKELKKRKRIAPLFYTLIGAATIAITIWGVNSNKDFQDTSVDNKTMAIAEMSEPIEPKTSAHIIVQRDFDILMDISALGHNELHQNVQVIENSEDKIVTTSGVKLQDDTPTIVNDIPLDKQSSIGGNPPTDLQKTDDLKPVKIQPDDHELKKPEERILDRPTYDKQKKNKDEIITEEPIKVITDLAGNFFNKDLSYKRDRNTKSDQLVSHHVKIGKFEFERKKH